MELPGRDTLDHLDAEQLARVAALYEARNIMTMHVPRPRVKPAAYSFELIDVARFITGDLDPATIPAVLVTGPCQCRSCQPTDPNPNMEDPDRG